MRKTWAVNVLLLPSLKEPMSLMRYIRQHYLSICSNKEPSFTILMAIGIPHPPNLN